MTATALPPPSPSEKAVLERAGFGAGSAVRLACQLRPRADLVVVPLLPPNADASQGYARTRAHGGEERYVVSMFVDMRGSTRLAEQRMPYDIVFIINRFLAAVSQAVIEAGGTPNQFLGDGLLALFGVATDPATASRQAIHAAALIARNVDRFNELFAENLSEPVRFGVGIHGGEVILGDVGYGDHRVFTAIGDAVNVTARLQELTKTLECEVVLSDDVCRVAGTRDRHAASNGGCVARARGADARAPRLARVHARRHGGVDGAAVVRACRSRLAHVVQSAAASDLGHARDADASRVPRSRRAPRGSPRSRKCRCDSRRRRASRAHRRGCEFRPKP